MQVLILTTDAPSRHRLRTVAVRLGCDVLEPMTLHAALEMLEGANVALVLCEPALPGVSHADVIARMRATTGGRDARVVAVGPTAVSREDLLSVGFDDRLSDTDDRALELYIAATHREYPVRLEAARERSRAETLRRLSLDLAWSTSVEQQALHALDTVRKALPVRGASLWLRDRQQGDVTCSRVTGLSPSYAARAATTFKVMSGREWLELTRAPAFFADARLADSPLAPLAGVEGFESAIHLALFTPTQVLGALAVYLYEPEPPTGERLELLQMIAAAVAMAIDQTQLRGRLATAESRLRAVLEQVPDGVFIQDAQGNFLMTNRAMSAISGYSASELELLNIADLVDEPAGGEVRERACALLGGEITEADPLEVTLVRSNERRMQVSIDYALLPPDDLTGDSALQGVVRDIDALVRARNELDTHEAIAEIVAEGRDFDGTLAGIVAAVRDRLGYDRGGIWTLSEDGEAFHARARFGATSTSTAARLRTAASTLELVWEALPDSTDEGRAISLPIVSGDRLIGVLDIEADVRKPLVPHDRVFLESLVTHIAAALDRARLHAELTRQAATDQVTGLANRRRFRVELDRIVALSDQPVSLLIAGIDGFKIVNDTYGDTVADDILRQIGEVMSARMRRGWFLARHSGDAFVALLPGSGRDDVVKVAEELRIAIAMQLFTAAEQVEQLTVSVGVATWPDEASSADELLAAASHALYLAKQAGRNQVFQSNSALAALAPAHGRIGDLLRQSPTETLALLVRAMDQRLPGRAGHAERVAAYAAEIARQMGVPESDVEDLRLAAHVHDIGMLTLPDSLLRKPTRLSHAERELLQGVPRAAYGMLVQLNLPELVLQAVVQQHERWDGSGYPSGLRGDAIPLGARIIAIADALDAMTSARAHREPMSMTVALNELHAQAGRQFDPDVVAAASALSELDLPFTLDESPDELGAVLTFSGDLALSR